jgi:hypothetical protein
MIQAEADPARFNLYPSLDTRVALLVRHSLCAADMTTVSRVPEVPSDGGSQ